MLLRICSADRKRFLIVVNSREELFRKGKELLSCQGNLRVVMEDDGSLVADDVLDMVFELNEKLATIMLLKEGEEWVHANITMEAAPTAVSAAGASPRQQLSDTVVMPSTSGRHSATAPADNNNQFNNLRSILDSHPQGKKLLIEYDQNKTLSTESRQCLVKITVAHLVEQSGMYPSKDQKTCLAKAIVTGLPGLKDPDGLTGHEHFFHESLGQKGYIQDRLKRLRRTLKPEEMQRPRSQNSQQDKSASTHVASNQGVFALPSANVQPVNINDAELSQLITDCKYANPASDRVAILNWMAKTAAVRQQWIRQERPSITEVIGKYPRMEDMPLDMLDIDFRVFFPETVDIFNHTFRGMIKGIIGTARLSKRTHTANLLRDYDAIPCSEDAVDRDSIYALLLLLQLLPSSNTRQKARLSAVELQSQFIVFKSNDMDLSSFVKEKKTKQPSLVCVGSVDNPGLFFLIVDFKCLSLGTCGVLRAFDALFKTHFVYWVDYSKPLEVFMEFIQKVVFQIDAAQMTGRVKEVFRSVKALSVS